MYVPFLFILLQMSGKILFPVYFWSIGPHFLFISGNIMLSDGLGTVLGGCCLSLIPRPGLISTS